MHRLLTASFRGSIAFSRVYGAVAVVCVLLFITFAASRGWSQTIWVDVDGNGRLERVTPNPDSPMGFDVYREGSRRISSPPRPVFPSISLHALDWNSNGFPDILTVRNGNPPMLWVNDQDFGFYRDEAFSNQFDVPVQSVTIVDISGGGRPELLFRIDNNTVAIATRPDGHRFELSYWQVGADETAALRDVNRDGRLDLVLGERVFHRSESGWNAGDGQSEVAKEGLLTLSLIGSEENPESVGASIRLVSEVSSRTEWVFPPNTGSSIDLHTPKDLREIEVHWPDGSVSKLEPPEGSHTVVRLAPPTAVLASNWSNRVDGVALQWRLSEAVSPEERALWRVVRTGSIHPASPVRFGDDGRTLSWSSGSLLHPEERCILTYAGRPVSVWDPLDTAVTFLPWPVLSFATELSGDTYVVDVDGDGRMDLLHMGHERDYRFYKVSRSRLSSRERLNERLAGLAFRWKETVNAAAIRWPMRYEHDFGRLALRIETGDLAIVAIGDVTGDGRPDLVASRPDGVVEVFAGTDGRLRGVHLSDSDEAGPAGPGDTVLVSIRNPGEDDLYIDRFVAGEGIELAGDEQSVALAAGESMDLPVKIESGRHESFSSTIAIVSESVDRGETQIGFTVHLGLEPDAPLLDLTVDAGVVQRDSVVTAADRLKIPWKRLREISEVVEIATGDAEATLRFDAVHPDTVVLIVDLMPHVIGDVSLRYPLRRGSVAIHATAVDTIPPPPPHAVAELSGDTLVVRWSESEADDLSHYVLKRIDVDDVRPTRIEQDTVWTVTDIAEGEYREYVVLAVDVAGNASSSEVMTVYRPDLTPPEIELIRPTSGSRDVDLDEPLVVAISDRLSDIDIESVRISINDVQIPPEELRFNGDGTDVVVTYSAQPWPLNATVEVHVTAADTAIPPNVADWRGSFTTVADTVIPHMTWVGERPAIASGGYLRADIDLPPDRQIRAVQLQVRTAGTDVVETLTGSISGRSVEFDVPPALISTSGMFHRWIVETDRRRYDDVWHWQSQVFDVPPDGLFWPGSGEQRSGSSLLAFPVHTEAGAILESVLDELRIRSSRSTLVGWDAESQRWLSPDELTSLQPGNAAYLSWEGSAPVLQAARGHTAQLDSAFSIGLLPGWNLVGQPFPYPVAWSDVLRANPEVPVEGPWMYRDAFGLHDIWEPWSGAWIYLRSEMATQLVIPPKDTVSTSFDTDRALAADELYMPTVLRSVPGWGTEESALLVISAHTPEAEVRDIALGWNVNAAVEWDPYDAKAPPSPDSSLVLWFEHNDWHTNAGRYAIDIRKPQIGDIWRLHFETTSEGPVMLSFSFLDDLPPGIFADFVDLITQDSIRLDQTHTTYAVRDLSRYPQREFAIVFGDNLFYDELEREERLAPSRLTLFQNYPNPFNNETTISYSIPAVEGGAYDVQVSVYNMLGQLVRRLYDGPAVAGMHTVSWNGRDDAGSAMSSGVYFCELRWGNERQLQRLIYVR